MAQLPIQRFRPKWGGPQFPELPAWKRNQPGQPEAPSVPELKQNQPAPSSSLFSGAREGGMKDALIYGGLTLMANAGPRPQGTSNFSQILGEAGMVAMEAKKRAELEGMSKDQLARMDAVLKDDSLMEGLTDSQRTLLRGLPTAQAFEVLTSHLFREGEGGIQQVHDPANNRTLLVDTKTGATIREISLGEDAPKLSFQRMEDGTLLGLHPETGETLVKLSPDGQKDSAVRILELRKDFDSKQSTKIWRETEVQLRAAQEAAAAKNGSADLALMIAAAKILDPTSVVREGEIGLQDMAQSKNDQVRGLANQWFTNNGRLSDNMRQNVLNTVERTARQRWASFEQEKSQLTPIYQNFGVDPQQIFGKWNSPTYQTLRSSPGVSNPTTLGPPPVGQGTGSAAGALNNWSTVRGGGGGY